MASGLTARQEMFCLKYIELGLAASAYDAVFPSDKRTAKSTWEKASQMMHLPGVLERIEELKAQVAAKVVDATAYDKAAYFKELDEIRDLAKEANDLPTLARATNYKGQSAGHHTEKKDITITMRPDEARATVASILAKYVGGDE